MYDTIVWSVVVDLLISKTASFLYRTSYAPVKRKEEETPTESSLNTLNFC